MTNILPNINTQFQSITMIVLIINAIVHVIFAGAVARDAGQVAQRQHSTHLVSPMTWAIATLVGGVLVAAIYWFMHHLNLTQTKK
jgi:hypothetical protein